MSTVDALRKCCETYERSSVEQQRIIADRDRDIRAMNVKIERLEKIIINNVKNGKSFL